MVGRFVDVLKYSALALVLLNVTFAVGCGDNATVEPAPVVEEGGENDPLSLSAEGPAKLDN